MLVKRVLIVGGGAAGWITAGYLARTLGAHSPQGVRITLAESAEIGILPGLRRPRVCTRGLSRAECA